jgi:glutamate-ammonia-ligase adenylyltransferase
MMPRASNPQQAVEAVDSWLAATAAVQPADAADAAALAHEPASAPLLQAMLGNSPYLAQLARVDPLALLAILRDGPEAVCRQVIGGLEDLQRAAGGRSDPGPRLRRAKRRLALATAYADISGRWSLEQVTKALSDFAGAALECAVLYLFAEAIERGHLRIGEALAPHCRSGLIILGMGKLGAQELNYSSDIDLIVLYDADRVTSSDPDALQRHLVRLTRGLARLMSDRTADGYVFRTDLRLRPDPASTPPAISVLAAEEYYESLGQNWERAALIKARPVAGDLDAGEMFLRWLKPFIWRKNLDFAAIQDIHSIKRQINSHRGFGGIAVPGHNVKLGRGGIREIEFFAQTQQLIWGGRLPSVRQRGTIEALAALAAAGKIDQAANHDLAAAYRTLRRVEHRLQMIDDHQTHTLPKETDKLDAIAAFLGFADAAAFSAGLLAILQRVEGYYAELFEDSPALTAQGAAGGNLVFTGGEPDPETLETLRRLGFQQPQTIDAAVRGWHHGRCRAMRSTRARELLTELMPLLLTALSRTPEPDATFLAFDRFLTALPAGVQLFSMFHANPSLLELVSRIIGFGPGIAEDLAQHPQVLESVVTAEDFFAAVPAAADLQAEAGLRLEAARDWEETLDLLRRWAAERRFQAAVQWLLGVTGIESAVAAWSAIAEAAVRCLLPLVEQRFAEAHGRIEGGGFAVVAMGKLGSGEMTARSDLDLIFVYATPAEGAVSDGPRPLPAAHYYARLSQSLISAMTAPTAEGRLYEVDMRLRPSGKAGPIAVSCESFRRYQQESAWTWEQMALTRARVIAGPPLLAYGIAAIIRSVLTAPRPADRLLADVAEMRALMARELGSQSLWDVKYRRGGLVDIEFISQYLQLREAHRDPAVLAPNTRDALCRLRDSGVLEPAVADTLLGALRLWHGVQSRLRLAFSQPVTAIAVDDAPNALRLAVTGLHELPFVDLSHEMQRMFDEVERIFSDLIEQPAAVLKDSRPAAPVINSGLPAEEPQNESERRR